MEKLYKFYWDYGRMGDVEGVFAADEKEVAAAIGKRIYFGEILGKHSEVFGPLNTDDLDVLTDDQEFIAKAKKYGLVPTGYNPLSYLPEEEDEGEPEDEDDEDEDDEE